MAKPRKVKEPTSPYGATPTTRTAEPGIRTVTHDEVRRNNGKLIQIHAKVLKKLAQ